MPPRLRTALVGTLLCVLSSVLQDVGTAGLLQRSSTGMAVWDTGQPSANSLESAAVVAKTGWTRIGRGEKPSLFQGDAVMGNGRFLAVLRQRGSAVELYSAESAGDVLRGQLRLAAPDGEVATRLDSVSVVEHSRSVICLQAVFQTAAGTSLAATFRLKRGDISIEIAPKTGAGHLRVECPGRFVILPDFFADDIVIDARKIALPSVDVPSENFLLHTTGAGDLLAMCVFENRDQDVKVMLSGEGEKRIVTGSEIAFGEKGKVWVALMQSPGVWHALEVLPEQAKQVRRLDWKMPFPAQWRIDFTATNDLTDSWEMLLQPAKDGHFVKPMWMGAGASRIGQDRKRWTTVLGRFYYPCWTDHDGCGFIQPLKHRKLTFEGPAVIYPINRLPETPIDMYTVVDVVRNSLGVGPCEYILNVEGQKQAYVGRATCAARDALLAIYGAGQQKQKRGEIEEALDDALAFVTHIRSRITQYVEFGREMREYLSQQRTAHPELGEFVTEMDKIAAEFDARLKDREAQIKSPEHVAELNAEFRKTLLDYEGPDAKERAKAYGTALTRIGGNQDELVGECRWVARTLRQRAGLRMAADPRCTKIAREIRARTQKVMLKPATYEAVRH